MLKARLYKYSGCSHYYLSEKIHEHTDKMLSSVLLLSTEPSNW